MSTKLTIKSRELIEKEVELTDDDIELVRSWMKDSFLGHVQFHDYRSCYQGSINLSQIDFCNRFGVDPEIDSDRIEFFKSVLGAVF